MNTLMSTVVLFAVLMMSQPVGAHTDESLDSMASPHGGQVRAAGPYHLELVVKDGALVLHVTDHIGTEISTYGGEGKASIQHGKAADRFTVTLEPSHDNTFTGHYDSQINPETVIVAFVKLPEQEAYAARFTPLKPKSVRAAGKHVDDGHGHDRRHDHH
jgi:hypothetical protein